VTVKITIDIPERELRDAMRFTMAKTRRDAVLKALTEFNRRHRMAELVRYSGSFKSLMTNEMIERLELTRMRRAFKAPSVR
jgi:hypothetical protein